MKSTNFLVGMMTSNWYVFLIVFFFTTGVSHSQVAINSDNSLPDASAMLDVKATGLGLLVPRMTLSNRPVTPATGLIIYQTDNDPGFYYYDGAAWQKVGSGGSGPWMNNGLDIYFNTGRVAIGGTDPESNGLYVQNYVSGKAAVRGTDQNGSSVYAVGMLGVLGPSSLGIPISVSNIGVLGIKPALGAVGSAVYGWNNDINTSNFGGIFAADGSSIYTNYAIYAKADNAGSNYAGWFDGRVNIIGNNNFDATEDLFVATVSHNQNENTTAITGISNPAPGYGIGIYGEGGVRGVYGYATGSSSTGFSYGVTGIAYGTAGTRIGVYGSAFGGTTNWAGYFVGKVYVSDMRVGTTIAATGYHLSVAGKIACEEVLVELTGNWPDYVFDKNYELLSLEDLESHIYENNHLPGLPSAKEVEENGFELADMQKRLLEKVEELTLYTIDQGKLINEQNTLILKLQNEVNILKEEFTSLKR